MFSCQYLCKKTNELIPLISTNCTLKKWVDFDTQCVILELYIWNWFVILTHQVHHLVGKLSKVDNY